MIDVKIIPTDFSSEGDTIRGNFVVPSNAPSPGICKFHGLPGGPDQVRGIATKLAEAGFAVLTFDFRGFRESDGLFSLAGEIDDAKAAITHLLESEFVRDSWIGVYGASYGGAVAVCSAAQDKRIDALALRAPVYDTLWFAKSPLIEPAVQHIVDNTPDQINRISDPAVRKQMLQRMIDDAEICNPMNAISKVSPIPLLVVHGTDDLAIDVAGVEQMYELAGEPKELILIEGADHELTHPDAYEKTMNIIVEWFEKQWRHAQ